MEKKQIRTILLYEFKNCVIATETARKVNDAFGVDTVKKRTVQWWFKKFHSGNENLEDEEGHGRHYSIDNEQLLALVESNPRTTIR